MATKILVIFRIAVSLELTEVSRSGGIGRSDGFFLKQNSAWYEHRQGASSKLKNLIWPRHIDASVGKMCRKLLHGVFFTVNKERTFRAGFLLPS
jgi:hypothetical protein